MVLDGMSTWLEEYLDTNKVYVSINYNRADMGQEV